MAGAPVQMTNGSVKPIEKGKTGDIVLSRDQNGPAVGKVTKRKVLRTSKRNAPVVVKVSLADLHTGRIVETITVSRDHPFYVRGKGFVPAGGLAIGNAIVTRAGPEVVVAKVEWLRKPNGYTVYNFEVEKDHTYFVGKTEGGVWVHNPYGECTEVARKLLFKRNEGWLVTAEGTEGRNLGIFGWWNHDAYIDSEGVITDVLRKLKPMSIEEWRNTFPYPEEVNIRYTEPEEMFSSLYRAPKR